MSARNTHLVVVGSGVAGLYTSLLAAEAGLRVTLLSKGSLAASNTHFAQGGICAVLGPEEAAPADSVEAHIADTLKAGAGHCDPEAVRVLCSEAHSDILALENYGVVFDQDPATGRRALGLEGAHSAARILHAGGDATGAAIAEGLIAAVRDAEELGTLEILEHTFMLDFMTDRGAVKGVEVLAQDGTRYQIEADSVLLASGGAGQLFAHTTNPSVATADGVAAAWRAGAALADLEFFQFHPTALAAEGNFLISEAVRGAGAVLRDKHGNAFMSGYHPEGDLAPRDVVSRSVAAHLKSINAGPDETVFLDATGVEKNQGAGYLAQRFPTIDAQTRKLGFDWSTQWLPVIPAAHYWMGGVVSDLDGRTSLEGLFVAGESACTGVHGANRLASNSLLEGLVFGRRAVRTIVADRRSNSTRSRSTATATLTHKPIHSEIHPEIHPAAQRGQGQQPFLADTEPLPRTRQALRELMSSHAGVVREAAKLQEALNQVKTWQQQTRHITELNTPQETAEPTRAQQISDAEFGNMLQVARLLLEAAMSRKNSLGAHFRSDFPQEPSFAERAHRDHADHNEPIFERESA